MTMPMATPILEEFGFLCQGPHPDRDVRASWKVWKAGRNGSKLLCSECKNAAMRSPAELPK